MIKDINQSSSINLDEQEIFIISEFNKRRNIFDEYIRENKINLATCPSCGYPTLLTRGGYEICEICNWEDDGQDDKNADEILGGPNGNLSLTSNRLAIGKKLLDLSEKHASALSLDAKYIFNYLDERHKNQQNEYFLEGLVKK